MKNESERDVQLYWILHKDEVMEYRDYYYTEQETWHTHTQRLDNNCEKHGTKDEVMEPRNNIGKGMKTKRIRGRGRAQKESHRTERTERNAINKNNYRYNAGVGKKEQRVKYVEE